MSEKFSPAPWKRAEFGLEDANGNNIGTWGSRLSFTLRNEQTEANGYLVDNAAELFEALVEAEQALRSVGVVILADKYAAVLDKARGKNI